MEPPIASEAPMVIRQDSKQIVLSAPPDEKLDKAEVFRDEETQKIDVTHDDAMPDGGYGWVIVFCTFMINSCTWGINATFGIFLSYYSTHPELYPGATTIQYAFVGGLSISLAFLACPLSNYLSTKMDFKYPMYLGAIFLVLSQCLAGLTSQIWQLFLTQGVMFGIGMGLMFLPSVAIIGQWFGRKKSLANGLSGSGSGAGGLVLAYVTRSTLNNLGLKWAFVINGCIVAVLLFPSIYFLKSRRKVLNARFEPLELSWLWHPGFVWVLLWSFCCSMAYVTGMYTVASYATIGLGETQANGAVIQSLLSAGQIVGRPFTGFVLDRFGRINMSILLTVIAGLCNLLIWLFAESFAVLGVFSFFLGFFGGFFWFACGPLTTELLGIRHLGSALAIFYLFNIAPNLCGEPIALGLVNYSREHLGRSGTGVYKITIGMAGGLYITGGLLLLGSRYWKLQSWKLRKRI